MKAIIQPEFQSQITKIYFRVNFWKKMLYYILRADEQALKINKLEIFFMNDKINENKLQTDLKYLSEVIRTHGLIYEDGAVLYDNKLVAQFYTNRKAYQRGMARLERAGYIEYQAQEQQGYKKVNVFKVDLQLLKKFRKMSEYLDQDFSDIDEIFDNLKPLPIQKELKLKKLSEYCGAVQGKDHVIRPRAEKKLKRIPHKEFHKMITPEEYEFAGYEYDVAQNRWVIN